MRIDKLENIVTELDQDVRPFFVTYYDKVQSVNVRVLVFGINIPSVTDITENYLADLAIDGVITALELCGVYVTLFGIKPAVEPFSITDEWDDPIRQ